MNDYAIRDTRTGEYVVSVKEVDGRTDVLTEPDGALMWRNPMDASRAHEAMGLGDEYEVVRL